MARGRIQYRSSPKAKMKHLGPATKFANIRTVIFWHGRFLRRHFDESAYGRYHFKRRTRDYTQRKRRVKRHNRPLFWSGKTMREALRRIGVTGTSKKATGKITAPALNWRRNREELIRTTKAERQRMVYVHRRLAGRKLRSMKTTSTVRT